MTVFGKWAKTLKQGLAWRDEIRDPVWAGVILVLFPVSGTMEWRQKEVRHKDGLLTRSFCHASFCLLLQQEEEQEQKSSSQTRRKWFPKHDFRTSFFEFRPGRESSTNAISNRPIDIADSGAEFDPR